MEDGESLFDIFDLSKIDINDLRAAYRDLRFPLKPESYGTSLYVSKMAKQFEQQKQNNMDFIPKASFGDALEAMKQGYKVARYGWNGKGMFLYYVSEDKYPVRMEAAKGIADEDGKVSYGAYIALKTVHGNVIPWVASQTDLLSDDWKIVD